MQTEGSHDLDQVGYVRRGLISYAPLAAKMAA